MPKTKATAVDHARHVRLFKNGRSQAVRIPKDMELPGDEAVIYREGTRLVIEPLARPSLTRLLSSWEPIDVAWPDIEDRTPEPVDLAEP
jgi:antitoxin VapB